METLWRFEGTSLNRSEKQNAWVSSNKRDCEQYRCQEFSKIGANCRVSSSVPINKQRSYEMKSLILLTRPWVLSQLKDVGWGFKEVEGSAIHFATGWTPKQRHAVRLLAMDQEILLNLYQNSPRIVWASLVGIANNRSRYIPKSSSIHRPPFSQLFQVEMS